MIVGYWNIQRASNPSGARWGYVDSVVTPWIYGDLDVPVPDLLVLSEVAQTGGQLAANLNGKFGYHEARYVPVSDKNGNPSPCSFIVLGPRPLPQVTPVGRSPKRPAVTIDCGELVVAAVHLIASNRERALDEAFTFCAENAERDGQRTLVIGDMNYDFGKLNSFDTRPFGQLGFEPVSPGMGMTFKSGQVYDYVWVNAGLRPHPEPPLPTYNRWAIIDHAPIAYEIY
jgi:hypothetical protein